jgi:hypothetical protein
LKINLICHLNIAKTKKYKEILEELKQLKKNDFLTHEGIGVRVYLNCNEEAGINPWFQDDDMKYMEHISENKFSIKLNINDYSRFQYRYIIIYDVPLFKKIGSNKRVKFFSIF